MAGGEGFEFESETDRGMAQGNKNHKSKEKTAKNSEMGLIIKKKKKNETTRQRTVLPGYSYTNNTVIEYVKRIKNENKRDCVSNPLALGLFGAPLQSSDCLTIGTAAAVRFD